MSILIRGVEMPTDHPMWIVVHSDGTVEANEVSQSRPVGWQTLRNAAVHVPPHGRLIDADALRDKDNADYSLACKVVYDSILERLHLLIQEMIAAAPTIIEAEEGET